MTFEVDRPQSMGQAKVDWRDTSGSIPFRAAQAICRVTMTTLFDLKVWNNAAVPRTGGVLIVSNHQSFVDPVALGVTLPRPLSYMAKSELFTNPFFSGLIRSLGAFPVRQAGSAAGAIKETIERLQEGRALNIYPEGSRTETGEIMPFQNGTALVIRKARVPIVPAAIYGSFDAYPSGALFPQRKPIRVLFGESMMLHELKADAIMATLDSKIRGMFDQLRALDPTAEKRRRWREQK